jgi:hypothetical protein
MKNHLRIFFKLIGIKLAFICIIYIGYTSLSMNEYFAKSTTAKKLFFTETNPKREAFDLTQLCSIESAALWNPNIEIHVISVNAQIKQQHRKLLFEKYTNLIFEKIDKSGLEAILAKTPLKDFTGRMKHDDEYTLMAQWSDLLQLALIYKYSGLYIDFDTITLRNFDTLFKLRYFI